MQTPEDKRKIIKSYYSANLYEKARLHSKECRKIHKDAIIEQKKAIRANRPKKLKKSISIESRKAYFKSYRDSRRSQYRAYRAASRSSRNLRASARLKAIPLWADKTLMNDIYEESIYQQLQVDHIVPLNSKFVCGLHWEGNLQLLSLYDNASKGNHWWPDK